MRRTVQALGFGTLGSGGRREEKVARWVHVGVVPGDCRETADTPRTKLVISAVETTALDHRCS